MPSRERVQAFVDAVLAGDFVSRSATSTPRTRSRRKPESAARRPRGADRARAEDARFDGQGLAAPDHAAGRCDHVVIGWRFDMTSHEA